MNKKLEQVQHDRGKYIFLAQHERGQIVNFSAPMGEVARSAVGETSRKGKKAAFTLAEGPRRTGYNATNFGKTHKLMRSAGFTLAEVLITIGVIGVVAALTIPGLITNVNNRVISSKKAVMDKKIVDGLNQLSHTENGLNVPYANTEEFVKALSKYLKIISICSNTELDKCFPYDKINYESKGQLKSENLTSITTAQKLKLEGNWLDPAGFIMADGTPVILSYNNDCGSAENEKGQSIVDPDKPLKEIPTACIDGLYDNNGTRSPNRYGKDVQPFYAAKVGRSCVLELGDLCIGSAPVVPTRMSRAECNANKGNYEIRYCRTYDDNDYWAGAKKMCQDQGMRLPTYAELAQMASEFYGKNVSPSQLTYATLNTSKIPESLSGLGSSWYYLWSGNELSPANATVWYFGNSYTKPVDTLSRSGSDIRAVCIGD